MNEESKLSIISTDNPMVGKLYDNTQSNIIRITDDKLKVILLENKDAIKKKSNFWVPLTLLITLILTFCTNDFKDVFGVPKDAWHGFYMFCGLGSLIWLIIELFRIKKVLSVDELLNRIRIYNETDVNEEAGEEVRQDLIIIKAIYGGKTRDKSVDVTTQLRQKITNNTLKVTASNDIAGDPDEYNPKKTLRIRYQFMGDKYSFESIQGQEVNLP